MNIPPCEVDRQSLQKKWVLPTHAIHLAAGLPEHQHAPRTQVGIEWPSVLVWHALECLLRPPRRCLCLRCCALPLRKNLQRGADVLAGTTRRIVHRQDRRCRFAQWVCGIFERVYRGQRYSTTMPHSLHTSRLYIAASQYVLIANRPGPRRDERSF